MKKQSLINEIHFPSLDDTMNSKEQFQKQFDWIIGQIGDVEARINYWKRFKFSPSAQAKVTYLKEIKESLKKKLKKLKAQLSSFP